MSVTKNPDDIGALLTLARLAGSLGALVEAWDSGNVHYEVFMAELRRIAEGMRRAVNEQADA